MQNKSDGFKKQIRLFQKSKSVGFIFNETDRFVFGKDRFVFGKDRFVFDRNKFVIFKNKFVLKCDKLPSFKNKSIKNKSKQ